MNKQETLLEIKKCHNKIALLEGNLAELYHKHYSENLSEAKEIAQFICDNYFKIKPIVDKAEADFVENWRQA